MKKLDQVEEQTIEDNRSSFFLIFSLFLTKNKIKTEGVSTIFRGYGMRAIHTGWHTAFMIFVSDFNNMSDDKKYIDTSAAWLIIMKIANE